MSKFRRFFATSSGVTRPLTGSYAPVVCGALVLAGLSVGCGEQAQEESLPVLQVGMTKDVAPIYDDGEMQIYEVKKGIAFPILNPTNATRGELNNIDMEPYGRRPW